MLIFEAISLIGQFVFIHVVVFCYKRKKRNFQRKKFSEIKIFIN